MHTKSQRFSDFLIGSRFEIKVRMKNFSLTYFTTSTFANLSLPDNAKLSMGGRPTRSTKAQRNYKTNIVFS